MDLDIPLATRLRQLEQHLFEDAKTQAERLGNSEDSEALHDFRVSLRRLRSFFKSFEGSIKNAKKLRGKLSGIMDMTNAGRDAEVHVAWLKARQKKASEVEKIGLEYLLEPLANHEHVDLEKVSKEFNSVTKKLDKTFLDDKNIKVKEAITFAAASADILKIYSAELQNLLQAIESPEDERIHEARIVGKRLRYTLELLDHDKAKALVKQLKKFQDTAGDLHDLQVLEPKVDTFLYAETLLWSQALRNGAKTTPQHELSNLLELQRSYGLAQVAHTLTLEKTALYQNLQADWLGNAGEPFFNDVNLFTQLLASEKVKDQENVETQKKPAKTKKVRNLAEAA